MFSELAKSRRFLIAALVLPLAAALFVALRQSQPFSITGNSNQARPSDALTKMQEALAKDRALLSNYEQDQAKLRAEVIRRRKLHQDGQISQEQVKEAEQSYISAVNRVYEMRHSVVETDIAITEAVLGEKVLRMPELPVNGFSETNDVARFNGGFKWSLREAPGIERYFARTFGRRLPVTAMGQSDTHNRLGFDHHDSMDVALHPDSAEGRAFIDHLRKAGIPFIAFRNAVPGASTGPHIHVGRPSGRLVRH
jgi:hypothetical protein